MTQVWFHRVTFPDGTVLESDHKKEPSPKRCFARITQQFLSVKHPGVKVEHIIQEEA